MAKRISVLALLSALGFGLVWLAVGLTERSQPSPGLWQGSTVGHEGVPSSGFSGPETRELGRVLGTASSSLRPRLNSLYPFLAKLRFERARGTRVVEREGDVVRLSPDLLTGGHRAEILRRILQVAAPNTLPEYRRQALVAVSLRAVRLTAGGSPEDGPQMALDLKRLRAAEAASYYLAACDRRRRLVAELGQMVELLPSPAREELLGLLLAISGADLEGPLTRPTVAGHDDRGDGSRVPLAHKPQRRPLARAIQPPRMGRTGEIASYDRLTRQSDRRGPERGEPADDNQL